MNEWEDAPEIDRRRPEWEDAPEIERRAPGGWRERFMSGLAEPVIGAAQIADRFIVDPIRQRISPGATNMEDVVRRHQARYQAPEGVDVARIVGNVANPISWAGGGPGVARAVGMGAVQAGLAPTTPDLDTAGFLAEKGKQMGLGGASAGVLAKVLPRALRGQVVKPTDEAQALIEQGVRVTPGQAAGGVVNVAEQKLTSSPLLGDVIQQGRRRALEDVQAKALERATGVKGLRSLEEANAAVSDLYRQAVPHLKANDEGFYGASEALYRATANPEMTPAHVKTLEGLFKDRFANYERLTGEGLKKLDSELGAAARRYTGHTATPADRVLGESLYEVRQGLREGLEVGMDPKHADTLRRANRAYREMIPINRAASARADQLATPRALQKAMARQAGTDVTRMRADPLLDPAVKALGSTVPDSGTAGRLGLPVGLAALLTEPVSTVAALGGTAAAMSGPGVKVLTGNTTLQRQLERMAPAARKALIAALRAQQAGTTPAEQ